MHIVAPNSMQYTRHYIFFSKTNISPPGARSPFYPSGESGSEIARVCVRRLRVVCGSLRGCGECFASNRNPGFLRVLRGGTAGEPELPIALESNRGMTRIIPQFFLCKTGIHVESSGKLESLLHSKSKIMALQAGLQNYVAYLESMLKTLLALGKEDVHSFCNVSDWQ